MYGIALESIDRAMNELADIREEIPTDDNTVRKMLKAWDKAFTQFGEREAFYYEAFMNGEDRGVVDAPLFSGNYEDFDFSPVPTWPDIETPWRLANELSTAAALAGANQGFLNDLEERFKAVITSFWENANAMIVKEKAVFEAQAANEPDESDESDESDGRVFGFWPLIAIGAVSLVGAFGAAAGYSAGQSGKPDEYVEKTPLQKHMKTAKTVGVGVLIGVGLAVVLMLRIRK